MIKIIQMDLLQRKFSKDQYGFIGVIYPQITDGIQEGPAYLLDCNKHPPTLYTDPILSKPDAYNQTSLDGLLKKNVWVPTNKEGFSLVRLIPLGKKEPGFVLYGANRDPIVKPFHSDTQIKLRQGRFIAEGCPHNAGKLPLASLLYKLPIWENLNGETILPTSLTTPAKNNIKEINEKRVDLGTKKITEREFKEWILKDPDRRFYSKFGKEDPQFLNYLIELKKANLLNNNLECMKPYERKAFHHQCNQICNKLLKPSGRHGSNDPGF